MRHAIIGTAGHIDHGKTALVRALTGVDTDRLAEEKRRGITIELGFAQLRLPDGGTASIIDVPGHEDFIRTMVAGATGIDVALLVVAADEGVMPQTREHLSIVGMLGVEHAVVALTKADLVEPEWLEIASDDVRLHLRDTPFREAAIVPVSARTGLGIAELVAALGLAVRTSHPSSGLDCFRMPVDRAFTMRGTGTVVTGTVRDGSAGVGADLRVLPEDRAVRVRAVQHHGENVERVHAGMRAALALVGIERAAAGRGSWLVAGGWPLSSMLTCRIRVVPDTHWEIGQRQRLRLHIGTAEVMARAVLLDTDRLRPGETGFVQLRLEAPVVARYGDRFVLRSYSPATTIGGGLVLEPSAPKRKPGRSDGLRMLAALEAGVAHALPLLVDAAGADGLPRSELPFRLGVASAAGDEFVLVADRVVSRQSLHGDVERLAALVGAWHREFPLRPGMEHAEASRRLSDLPPWRIEAVIDLAVREQRLERASGLLRQPGFRPLADSGQAALRERIAQVYLAAGLVAPTVDELPADLRTHPQLRDLLGLLEREGTLHPWPPDRYLHREVLAAARRRLDDLGGRGGLGPADFRALFDLPRKHLIPLLEYFDRLGWTRRDGELRSVAQTGIEMRLPGP